MDEKKKLQPKVRFREFTGENAPDWEQRKLGEVSEIIRGASPRPIQDPKWFDDNSDVGWLRISDVTNQNGRVKFLEQKISKLAQKKTRVLETPHLLLSIAASVGKPVINYTKTGVHDGFLIFINPKFDLYFMFQWLEMFKPIWQKYGQPGSQVNLNSDIVKNHKINIPSDYEQERIGEFFEKIDKLITLHQRKLEQLEQLKNTLLSKMFPKSGTNIPEIRFSGFTDAWKQRKLEEIIVKEIKGKAKSENISTNFANKGSLYLDTEYLNGGKPKYVSLPSDTDENDIIILWDGSQAGKLYKGVVGALGSTLKAYKIPEHTLFYYYQMLGSQEKIYNQYRTPNIPHVVKSFTSEFMIWDTSNDEKTLIIDIYSNLFNYIAIHQRKLEQLINLKQTLLNKMFI